MSSNLPSEVLSNMPVGWEDLFQAEDLADDLSAGAGSVGFNSISIRGSRFRVKSGDEEKIIVDEKGDPVASLDVVILKANKHVSKIWYEKSYSEGDAEAPDCFSNDGEKPDPQSQKPQAKQCMTCPKAQWGSRITESGAKAKACSDSRVVAVWVKTALPDGHMNDEPLMLRIPAVSLKDLAIYGKAMASKNAPYNRIVTRIRFDTNVSFPKLTYSAVCPVPDEQLPTVASLIMDEKTSAILAGGDVAVEPTQAVEPTSAVNTEFEEQPEQKEEPKKATRRKAKPKPEPTEIKADEPEKEQATESKGENTSSLDDDLDSIIADLEGLD